MNETNGKENGQKEYKPEVEFEYLDADVWIKESDAGKSVAYTEEVLEALEDDEKSESED